MRKVNVASCFLLVWCLAGACKRGNCRDFSYERHYESHEDDDDLQVEASVNKKVPVVQDNKENDDDDLDSHEGWQGGKIYEGSWWDGWARGWHASVKKQSLKNKLPLGNKETNQPGGQKAESKIRGQVHNDYEKKHRKKFRPHGYKMYGYYGHYGGYRYPNPYYYGRYGYKTIPYGTYRQSMPYYGGYRPRLPYYANYPRPYVGHHQIYGQRYGSYNPMYRSQYSHAYRG